ncbi:hypothetical protein TNIN_102971 [Trichonephila inaurata madagascariensis]|uniref:Uncharacterized protein n=1 Tax=Trichonephila inaurata madagascariensis TaxID=2747483 RepID=A0A8X6X1Q3_9ARAC|nr:hypothetical protein TNIN_102971 [Trichonephila inaurata madagascariensis]
MFPKKKTDWLMSNESLVRSFNNNSDYLIDMLLTRNRNLFVVRKRSGRYVLGVIRSTGNYLKIMPKVTMSYDAINAFDPQESAEGKLRYGVSKELLIQPMSRTRYPSQAVE